MAKAFISITPSSRIGSEIIANVFWYTFDTGLETEPSAPQLGALADNWVANVKAPYLAILPSDLNMATVTAKGWKVDGTPGEVLPVIRISTGAGALSSQRDSKGHVAKIAFSMGDLVAFSGGAGALRSSRVLMGPLVNPAVDEDGTFLAAGVGATALANLLTAVAAARTVAVAGDALAVRVSHVVAHVTTPNVASYRNVNSAFVRTTTGFLRRRTNQR